MRHRFSALLFFLAFESAHSWQVPPRTRQRWQSSSRSTSTQLDVVSPETLVDPAAVPALTASAALFVGAAGVLLYNRLAVQERKQNVKEALPDNKQQDEVLKDEKSAEASVAEEVNADMVITTANADVELTKVSSSVSSSKEGGGTVEKKSDDVMKETAKGVTTTVLESPVKTNGGASLETGGGDRPPSRNGSDLSKQDDVSTVGAPKIVPTAEERAIESPSRDESAEPSFISLLEQKSSTASTTTDDEPTQVEADDKKETEPSFMSYLKPSNKTMIDVKPKEEESTEKQVVAKQPAGVATTTPEKAKETNSVQSSLQAKSAPLPVKETVKSSLMPAASVKDVPPAVKGGVSQKTEAAPARPKSTVPTVKSISKPDSSNNGVTPKPLNTPKPLSAQKPLTKPAALGATTSGLEKKQTQSNDDPSKGSLKNSLSILTNTTATPGKEEDDDIAMASLQQHIQDQARDMTRKKMDEKTGILSSKAPTETESLGTAPSDKSDTVSTEDSSNAEMPVFYAPTVDDPYEAVTKDAFSMSLVSSTDESDEEVNVGVSTDSEEQVAKSLKKTASPSLTKKARQSVLLVALATGAVVVGKRLASVVIGRGML